MCKILFLLTFIVLFFVFFDDIGRELINLNCFSFLVVFMLFSSWVIVIFWFLDVEIKVIWLEISWESGLVIDVLISGFICWDLYGEGIFWVNLGGWGFDEDGIFVGFMGMGKEFKLMWVFGICELKLFIVFCCCWVICCCCWICCWVSCCCIWVVRLLGYFWVFIEFVVWCWVVCIRIWVIGGFILS